MAVSLNPRLESNKEEARTSCESTRGGGADAGTPPPRGGTLSHAPSCVATSCRCRERSAGVGRDEASAAGLVKRPWARSAASTSEGGH